MLLRFITAFSMCCPLALLANGAAELTSDQLSFFENRIRPVLAESCYQCHAEDSEKLKGSLLLDSKAGWMRGGDIGQVIVPGDAENSLLVHMIRHEPDYDAMPPKSKLSEAQIADFVTWINEGAFDPRDQAIGEIINQDTFDLEERKKWWSFQPIRDYSVPEVTASDWPNNAYDHFILSALESKGWSPAEPASKASLLRRLSFDLIGLAPTPDEMDAFLADASPDAYTKQVDRLLASPHFGEKWARHWMDLVRYAETKSFEFDYTMTHAHQYRNYLIRMFNEDVPYDDFIRESLAGDLMEEPRYSDSGAMNESLKGPGFMYLTDGQHGPPDLHDDEARIFSGMIDTTSKAFLGVTVACAECHDHKFDAITHGDYYSWYGMLRSSRLEIANTIHELKQVGPEAQLKQRKPALLSAAMQDAKQDVERVDAYIEAVRALTQDPEVIEALQAVTKADKKKKAATSWKTVGAVVNACAQEHELDQAVLLSWMKYYTTPELYSKWPSLASLFREIEGPNTTAAVKLKHTIAGSTPNYPTDLNQWITTGPAFEVGAASGGFDFVPAVKKGASVVQTLVSLEHTTAGLYSGRVGGSLRSPDFILDGSPVELYAKGKQGNVSLIVRNYEQVGRGPTTKVLDVPLEDGVWKRISIPTVLWVGEPAYIEVLHDGQSRRLRASLNSKADDSFVTISTAENLPDWSEVWGSGTAAQSIQKLWEGGLSGELSPAGIDVLGALFESGLIRAGVDRSEALKQAMAAYVEIHNTIPEPVYARSLVEGTPQDTPIYIRGSHKSLSKEPNPRRFLDGLGGVEFNPEESGRREFAEQLVSQNNPLVSRVMVNRLWHHLFGRGIVASVDDFGKLGSLPSHPELLDYLAKDFMAKGWSIKQMIREMVLSATYQMSTIPNAEVAEKDPENTYLQHMPIKRLEAEQIRDHMLFCSNELKPDLYGPSVKSFAADLPRARGYPGSGPVNGNGRRSVYIELRRNFMPSFLRVLGMPNGTEPTGKRGVTNVPSQSLALMNSQFVEEQAKSWAASLIAEESDAATRIDYMHQQAFGRPANEAEMSWAKGLLADIREIYTTLDQAEAATEVAVWQELCHVMMNRKEFIYLY